METGPFPTSTHNPYTEAGKHIDGRCVNMFVLFLLAYESQFHGNCLFAAVILEVGLLKVGFS
jgi:hypothetical protein